MLGNVCACMGPQNGQPHCPCQMQRMGLSDGKEYAWTQDDKDRLAKALKRLSEDKGNDHGN